MAVRNLKIVVAGRINAGKSYFIENISVIDVVTLINTSYSDYIKNAEWYREKIRDRNFRRGAATEQGRIVIDDELTLSLHSMASNLASISSIPRGMHGYVVLVDSTDPRSFYEARALLLYMAHFPRVPYIVVANKQDLEGALTVEQIRQKMRLPARVPMMGCIAKERDSVRNVLLELLYMILPDEPK
jgi:signal recognition particle receptor subunit beta